MAYHQSISSKIAVYLDSEGETKSSLAERLSMSPETLRNKRSGATDWTMSELIALSDITGDSVNELLGLDDEQANQTLPRMDSGRTA